MENYIELAAIAISLLLIGYCIFLTMRNAKIRKRSQHLIQILQETEDKLVQLTNQNQQTTKEFNHLKSTYQELLIEVDQLQKQKTQYTSKIRDLEAEVNMLQENLLQAQNPAYLSRSGMYTPSEDEIAKRIREAVDPWQRQVAQLESELDLLRIESSTGSNHQASSAESASEKIDKLTKTLEQKEQENIALRLRVNQLINAYNELKNSVKSS